MPIVQVQFTCKCMCPSVSAMVGFKVLIESCHSLIRWQTISRGICTNLFLSRSTMPMPSCRHGFVFMTGRTYIFRIYYYWLELPLRWW